MDDDDIQPRASSWLRLTVRWAGLTAAPWALGAGLLLSFTAIASNGIGTGTGAADRRPQRLEIPATLVPAATAALVREATFDLPSLRLADVDPTLVSLPPRAEAKRSATADELHVVRAGKAASLQPRPSFSRAGLDLFGRTGSTSLRLAFLSNRSLLPPTVLMSGTLADPDWEAAHAFEPLAADDATMTRLTSSVQSPAAAAAGSTGPGRGPSGQTPDGASPSVSRAAALASTTPAPAEGTPAAVAAAPVTPGFGATLTARIDPALRPRYADMIAPAALEREQRCLAEAVYFEARSEPEEGRAAVAQVVLNRVRSGLYPPSICGVVYQNRHRHLACQFTFACEGKALRVTEPEAWDSAQRIAANVLQGRTYLAEVGAATHYHADYVRPSWARKLKRMDVIGRHIFYELRPGQT